MTTRTLSGSCLCGAVRFIEQYGMVFIPAGSLDDEPDLGPQARIFTGSRTAWSCNERHLPEFDEYPG